jgi:hypothetical protein
MVSLDEPGNGGTFGRAAGTSTRGRATCSASGTAGTGAGIGEGTWAISEQVGSSYLEGGLNARRCDRRDFIGWLRRELARATHGPGLRGDLRSGEYR